MMKSMRVLSAVLLASAVHGYGQEQLSTSGVETPNMKLSIGMDKETYLPGEVAQFKLTVTNLASTSVVTLKPFLSSTSCFSTTYKVGDQVIEDGEPGCGDEPLSSSNTTTFGPGESKQIVLNSYDHLFDLDDRVMDVGSVSATPDKWDAVFRYGTAPQAQVEYTVAPAKLEADTITRVHDYMFSPNPGVEPQTPISMYVHVISLRSEGQSYICVQQTTVGNTSLAAGRVPLGSGLDVTDPRVQMIAVIPFKRVVTSSASVVSVSARADSDENLMIEWTDSEGKTGHMFYPASYPARQQPQELSQKQ